MPTPRERANAVVTDWQATLPVLLETQDLTRLAVMVAGAIDAQVKDWQASVPPPNGWGHVAKASHVVAHEPEQHAPAASNGPESSREAPPAPVDPLDAALPCPHLSTAWDSQNQYLICRECGEHFWKGICIRCGQPAVSDESFSCGKACR